MPPIEHADFLQRFMTLLDAAGTGGVLPVRGPELSVEGHDVPQRRFADVYGKDGNLLLSLAAQAQADDDPGMAGLLTALDQALHTGTLEIKAKPNPAPRLTAYVYPVV